MAPLHLPALVAMLMLFTTTANAAASELDADAAERRGAGVSTARLWFPGANNEPLNAKATSATPTSGAWRKRNHDRCGQPATRCP